MFPCVTHIKQSMGEGDDEAEDDAPMVVSGEKKVTVERNFLS